MHADNSAALAENARERARQTLQRATRLLAELEKAQRPVSIVDFAHQAQVSRSWIYSQPDVMNRLQSLRLRMIDARATRPVAASRASDDSLLMRLELAHQRIRKLSEENAELRQQLARSLGELRTARLGVHVNGETKVRRNGDADS